MKKKTGDLKAQKKLKLVKFSVQRNIFTLQRMIPGCDQDVDIETLFQKSIDHIVRLKLQVHLLESLIEFYEI